MPNTRAAVFEKDMEIKVVKTKGEYQSMLSEAERLVALDPVHGSSDADKLELLTVLLEDFEKRTFPFDLPDPIDAIEFRMTEQGLRQVDLVPLLGSRSRVSEVLSRKRPLTVQMIRALSTGLGIPLDVLVAERSVSKPKLATSPGSELDLSKFPVREMLHRGWITVSDATKKLTSVHESAEKSLKVFLSQVYQDAATPALFRRTFRGEDLDERTYYSTLAWSSRVLARVKETESRLEKFDPLSLSDDFFLHVARQSRFDDGPRRVITILAEKGIALIIEPKLPNTLLDGATLMSESGTPAIGMTLRYDRIDYFWFTLLHELAHVWKHISTSEEAFIDRMESTEPVSLAEKQANRIARDSLIPRAIWKRSNAYLTQSRSSILQLAEELCIHPAIVVGRLQKENERFDLFREMLGQGTVTPLFPDVTFK